MMNEHEFKREHEKKGGHWFSTGAMSFFSSKIVRWFDDTGYFITTEVDPSGKKMYSIRQADYESFDVKTIGEFHSHKTMQAARKWLEGYEAGTTGDVEIQSTGG